MALNCLYRTIIAAIVLFARARFSASKDSFRGSWHDAGKNVVDRGAKPQVTVPPWQECRIAAESLREKATIVKHLE